MVHGYGSADVRTFNSTFSFSFWEQLDNLILNLLQFHEMFIDKFNLHMTESFGKYGMKLYKNSKCDFQKTWTPLCQYKLELVF